VNCTEVTQLNLRFPYKQEIWEQACTVACAVESSINLPISDSSINESINKNWNQPATSSTRLDDISHLTGGHALGESCIITVRTPLGTEQRILIATCTETSALAKRSADAHFIMRPKSARAEIEITINCTFYRIIILLLFIIKGNC
jgi:hypothetical protein